MKWSDYLVPSTKYANHNLSTTKRFTASPGLLYPVWHRLMTPGDKFQINLRTLIRTNPVKSPLMGSFKVRFVTVASNIKNYAIALEGYNRNFDWRNVVLPQFAFKVTPAVAAKGVPLYQLLVRETSLADYLGYQRGWLPTRQMYNTGSMISTDPLTIAKSALPFLTYYDFYRNYLVNPQEEYYPICTAPDGTEDYSNLPPSTDSPEASKIWDPGTYVRMNRISDLDNWLSEIHKMYDATSDASTSDPTNWNCLGVTGCPIRWSSEPEFGDSTGGEHLPLKCNTFSAFHGGLVGTMFDPDINTNWMSVSNYSKLGSVQVNVLGNQGASYVNYQDMIKASSIWDFVFREVTGGGTYSDLIYSQYGVSVKSDQNIPQVIHVFDTTVGFEDVTATAEGIGIDFSTGLPVSGSQVGEQFGVGRGYSQSPRFTVSNPDKNFAMLMTFMWITPNVDYATGVPAESNITKFSDLYFPAFDNYSMQPRFREQWDCSVDFGTYQLLDPSTAEYGPQVPADPFAYGARFIDSESSIHNWNDVLGYQPAYTEYKTDVNTVHGLFRTGLSYWANIRVIPQWSRFERTPLSSYVLSSPIGADSLFADALGYETVFSVKDEDNFQCQVRFDVKATRPISKSVMPHIK